MTYMICTEICMSVCQFQRHAPRFHKNVTTPTRLVHCLLKATPSEGKWHHKNGTVDAGGAAGRLPYRALLLQ